MTKEKFQSEIFTLKKFYEYYCKDNHTNLTSNNITLEYKDSKFILNITLCEDCKKNIEYSFLKVQECKHEIKPRCRKCPNPCYDKSHWKNTAKIMRYSGIKLGLVSIKRKIKNIFK
ncbi:nitrous oxide-stimulated promoter family protein [Arcobacter sp. CECT 8985]|uniref:nitrous oxide-stimulated promoter family protein n=1 Tax=Arcobacter sp. CECT 8985 TaxID=1935424 RepID=UPI00100B2AF7|nr:nitrous oxide-stimulated promoter family protein [Arcobacter sp. CECT 8985]RXJ84589.1 hypothetical protein CRU93_12320 [Arcobacter sp. CECT 8985]